MKEDRRTRKSKRAMKRTLFELMRKKPYADIRISELCQLADLNRSTFYGNFSHMDELLKEIHFDLFDAMVSHAQIQTHQPKIELKQRLDIITGMVKYIQINHAEVHVLFYNNDNHLLERNMLQFFTQRYSYNSQTNQKNYPLLYHTIGFFTLLNQWVKDQYPCTAEALAEMIISQSAPIYETDTFDADSRKEFNRLA